MDLFEAEREPRIDIRATTKDTMLHIEVQDNGPGIPVTELRRIFEPFFTTKAPGIGTGLGVSVSYFIITKGHGGTMRAESIAGQGATFSIDLPIFPTPSNQ